MDAETLSLITEFSRDVAVLEWPAHESERRALDRIGLPRLLMLTDAGARPPFTPSCLEDWARVPIESSDLRARLATLAARSKLHTPAPTLDALGQVWNRGKFARLSPTEERLVRVLIEQYGEIVSDQALIEAGWDGDAASTGALRIHLTRLRRRLRPLGLHINTRRGAGHLLHDAADEASVSLT